MALFNEQEIADLWRDIEEANPPGPIEIFRPARPLSAPEDVLGVSSWPEPTTMTGSIKVVGSRPAIGQDGDPEAGETCELKARYTEAGKVQAGDVLRTAKDLYFVPVSPVEREAPFPKVACRLIRLKPRFVPKALRRI